MTIGARALSWSASGRIVVDGVTVDVEPGTMLGLLGPNGSGKSSLLRLLCGVRRPGAGIVTLAGRDIAAMGRREVARRVALVEQQAATEMDLCVLDVVRLGRIPHRAALSPRGREDDEAVQRALAQVGLSGQGSRSWHTLSGGERQRVHIARALAQAPSELLLDEPTNHLDIRHQLEILSLVAALPVTSVVALHDLNLAAMFCDSLIVLERGRVVAGGPAAEVLSRDLLARVFGVDAVIGRSPHHGKLHIQFLAPCKA
jgi:iron complex transport system ATP-binding protein